MYTHDVFITVRQKSRQSTLCIVIKGIEKFITNIYEARHSLLKLTAPKIAPDIPPTYFGPNDKSNRSQSISQLLAGPVQPFSPLSPLNPLPYAGSWQQQQMPNVAPPEFAINHIRNQLQNMQFGPNKLPPHLMNSLGGMTNKSLMGSNCSMNSSGLSNISLQVPQLHSTARSNNSDIHSSGYQSLNCSSNSLDQHQTNSNSASTTMANHSPESVNNSLNNRCRHLSYGDSPQHQYNDMDQKTPLVYEQKANLNDSFIFNFDPRIVAGFKAMHLAPQQGELRTPTPSWQGLGISHTSPVPLESCSINWENTTSSGGASTIDHR
jgi:protein bicaudal C